MVRVDPVHVGLERDLDAVGVVPVLVGEELPGRLHADDAERNALDDDVAADRVGSAEELGRERRADDGDRRVAALVVFRQPAAEADRAVHQRRVLARDAHDEHALASAGDPHGGRASARAG